MKTVILRFVIALIILKASIIHSAVTPVISWPNSAPKSVKKLSEREMSLLVAIARHNEVQIQELLNSHVNVSFRARVGRIEDKNFTCGLLTPLHIAAAFKAPIQIYKLLLYAGANINAQDADGNTPLLTLFEYENETPDIVKFFLELNADPEIQDYYGNSLIQKIESKIKNDDPNKQSLQELLKLCKNQKYVMPTIRAELIEHNLPPEVAAIVQTYISPGNWHKDPTKKLEPTAKACSAKKPKVAELMDDFLI